MTHHIELGQLHLKHGKHHDRQQGVCLLEAVAWWADEIHTDHPVCVSRVLGTFGRRLNDLLPEDKRQQLVPLIPVLAGTADDGQDLKRAFIAADWAARTCAPIWFDAAGLTAEAAKLRALPAIVDKTIANEALPVIRGTRSAAAAAADAAAYAAAAYAAYAAAAAAAADAAAARTKLAPIIDQVHDSAIAIFKVMIHAVSS